MAAEDLSSWLGEWNRTDVVWFAKRLAANDTLASGSHQAGPYIPKNVLFGVFPKINDPSIRNPERRVALHIDSHAEEKEVRVIWYNNRLFGGTRDEMRITNFGGRSSALLDPESTGTIVLFVFVLEAEVKASEARVWVCRNVSDEEVIESVIGPVEPGRPIVFSPSLEIRPGLGGIRRCSLEPEELPAAWLKTFPTGADIIRKTMELCPARTLDVDSRVLKRRECEYEVFLSVERAIELPHIRAGFTDVDAFIARAQTVLQRRKARSGRSLELHVRELLIEEGFREGESFSHQPESEPGKRPDFLFPSEGAYKDSAFAAASLRMLAVKTTCKDRWRQVLNEADRIPFKHLLTLQEGVSETQFREMSDAGVKLVVPKRLHNAYPKTVRPSLLTVASFLESLK